LLRLLLLLLLLLLQLLLLLLLLVLLVLRSVEGREYLAKPDSTPRLPHWAA
jgi:hypothetical protein